MEDESTIAAIFIRTKYRFIVYLCAKIIKIIKNKRNDLAHGSISFEQCGQNIPLFSMQENYRHASNALLALFNGINSYLDQQKYLKASP